MRHYLFFRNVSNEVVAERSMRLPMFEAAVTVTDRLRLNTGGHRGVF